MGLNALTSKVLCRRHNSTLESVDRGGITAINAFDETITTGTDSTVDVNGTNLERWLLKIAININCRGTDRLGVGMLGADSEDPAPYLLEAVFGNRILECKMGAYFLLPVTQYYFRRGEIVMAPVRRNGEIAGMYFNLRGVHVFLSLFPGHEPPKLAELGGAGLPDEIINVKPVYRPPSLIFPKEDGTKSEIVFKWGS